MNTKDKKMYQGVIDRYKGCCAMCGGRYEHLHHVYYGKNRSNSTKWGMVVPLCNNCHNYVHKTNYQGFKVQYQQEFEKEHTREEFIKIFGRNYCD